MTVRRGTTGAEISILAVETEHRVAGMTRPQRFAAGLIDPEDLDDEEVWRQEIREDDGSFSGAYRRAKVPRALVDEKQRRILTKGATILQDNFTVAVAAIAEIAGDPNQAASDRIRAASLLIDRVAGKAPERVHISASDPIEQLFKRILQDRDGLEADHPDNASPNIMDAEIVLEDDAGS